MDIASLGIAIDSRQAKTAQADLDRLTGAGTRAERAMGGVGAGGRAAAAGSAQVAASSRTATTALNSQAMAAQRVTAMIRSYAAAAVGAFGVREVVQAADAWQGLENRLRLVTQTNTQLRASMNDVYSIAQRTSSSLDAVGQVYQRFAQNASSLGLSLGQVATLSETVSKAVAVSGAEAGAAQAALMQFGQALASGVLRGEEFNSIMEQTPALMQALATGMGVSLGSMRDLAAEGKITGDVIVQALTRASGSVDEQFNTRIKTVGQSFTELGNAVTRYIGEMSGATGASNGLAGGISSVADAIDEARSNMDGLRRELDGFRVFGELVVDAWEAVDEFGQNFQRMLGITDGDVRSLGDTIVTSFTESLLTTAQEVDAFARVVLGHFNGMVELFKALGQNIVIAFQNAFNTVRESMSELMLSITQAINDTFGTNLETSLWVGPGNQEFRSLVDAYKEGAEVWKDGFGAYDALARRVGDIGIWRAAEEAMAAYTEEVENSGEGTKQLGDSTDKTKKKISDAAKAAQQFEQQRRAYLRSQYQEISNLSDQADALEDQVRYYGLSESALNDLTIARLREQQAALTGIEGAQEEIAIRERMIEQYQRIGIAMQGLEAKEAEKAAWESWSRDVEQIFDQVGQSLTDAIFEGGKSGRDLVKDLFRTLTVNVLINPVMNAIQGQVTQQLGGMFGYQNQQAAGGTSGFDFNQFMGGGTGNMLSSAGNYIGSSMVAEFGAGLTAGAGGALTDASASALMNIGTNGSSSFAAGSSIGGIGLGSIAGYGSALVNLAEGNYGSAAGAAIGTYLLPGIGTAVGSLLGGFADDMFGGGPPKTRHGQRTTIDYAGGQFGVSAIDDRQAAGSEQAALAAVQAAVTQANEMFARLGVDAAIESFYAVMESSVLGDRQGVASGGMLRTGDQMRQIGIPQASDMTFGGFGGWSSAEMLPRLLTDIQLSILEAFQTQVDSLPDVLADMIRGVDVRALDAAGAQDLAARFSAVVEGASSFLQLVQTMPFDQLRDLSFDAAAGLVEVAGGLQNLTGNLNTYYENFYSEAERNANTLRNVAKALEEVGVALPDTRQQFRALVEAQDLTTDAGRRVYAALLNVSGAFASVTQSAEQAAQEQQRIAQERRDSVIRDLESAYSAVVSAGQAEIARLQQSFGATDSAMNSYRSAVQALESEFGSLFSSIGRYISDLRGNVEASAQAQYRQARAVISTALATGQLPQTADLTEALQVAQRGVTSQVYGSLFEQNRAYAILANEMEALKAIAEPELDAARATLAQLEEQYALLRGTNRIAGDSLEALERQLRVAFSTEEAARSQISLIEQQLETAKQQYEELMGINSSITDLAAAIREFAAAAAAARTVVGGGGGGGGGSTGGWTPDNLPAGAENLSAAQQYVLYNEDLLKAQPGSGMSVEQFADFHWNTYGQYEDRAIGLASYAVGTDYVPRDMTANIHRGEIIINPRDADILRNYGIRVQAQGGDSREMVSELRALREQNARLERRLASIEQSTGQLADQFDNATAGGNAMAVEAM